MDPSVIDLLKTFVVGLPATIAAIAGLVATLLLHKRSNRKLDHITELGNGTLSVANERIAQLDATIKKLIEQNGARTNGSPRPR